MCYVCACATRVCATRVCACVCVWQVHVHMLCMLRVQHVRGCVAGAPQLPHMCHAYALSYYVLVGAMLDFILEHEHIYGHVALVICTIIP